MHSSFDHVHCCIVSAATRINYNERQALSSIAEKKFSMPQHSFLHDFITLVFSGHLLPLCKETLLDEGNNCFVTLYILPGKSGRSDFLQHVTFPDSYS